MLSLCNAIFVTVENALEPSWNANSLILGGEKYIQLYKPTERIVVNINYKKKIVLREKVNIFACFSLYFALQKKNDHKVLGGEKKKNCSKFIFIK